MSTETTAAQPHPNAAHIPAPDLTQRPPRSARLLLGGYALLPRMLDKGRAELVGKNGDYHYNCPLDQYLIGFLGVDAGALREQLAAGKGDGEILAWIKENMKYHHADWQIEAWSRHQVSRPPANVEGREFFHNIHKTVAPNRDDIASWADVLDLDDHASFGGKP